MPTHVPSRGIRMSLYPTVDVMFLQVNKAVYTVHPVWLMWLFSFQLVLFEIVFLESFASISFPKLCKYF